MHSAGEPQDVGGAAVTGIWRQVTVLFADLSDSSRLAEELEPEEYFGLLEDFRARARAVIARHGGNVARMQGDGLLALFGHVEPREDDGRRATEAALQLHEEVGRLPSRIPVRLHSGIHSGLVMLAEGDMERGRFDVYGEVPNTAARLCSLAGAGEVLVSQGTLGPLAHFFRATVLRQIDIRGRSTPLDALRIDGRAEAGRRIDAAAASHGVIPFIGRSQALQRLHEAARRAREGSSELVVITGEPGIGKTRLVAEFTGSLDPAAYRVLQGYCESYLGAEPLQPFMQWIRTAMGRAPGSAPQGPVPGGDGAPAGNAQAIPRPAELVGAVIELIALLARTPTLVLVLDDWQWADDASRQALDALLTGQERRLVIVASRPLPDTDPALARATTLHLQPFDEAEAGGIIAAWLPGANPFTAQEIYRLSGGTPLFIEELCHAAEHGQIARPQRSTAGWINSLVASRLARLPQAQADLLRAASVVGTVFPDWLLQQLSGTESLASQLETLSASDFLAPAAQPGLRRFKHVLTRDAVYATVPPAQRRALHRRVADILESAAVSQDAFESLEALSFHYDAAQARDRAAHYAEAAGDKALAAMAVDRARAHYTTALQSLDALGVESTADKLRWCAIAQKLGQACVFDPLDVGPGTRHFERAVQLARESGDLNALARAEYWLGYINYGRGRARDAVRSCSDALGHAMQSGDARLAAQVEATLGQALVSAGRYAEGLPMLAHAVQSKRQQAKVGSRTAVGSAYTLARTGYTLGDLGRFDEAHEAFAEALRLLGDKLHSVGGSVHDLIGAVHLWQGRWEDARAEALVGADIAMHCRSRYLVAMGRALGACASWAAEQSESALQALRESTLWIEAHGGAISMSLPYGWLVEACVTLGREDEARQHAARLFVRARAQDRHGLAMGCRALARLAAAKGDAVQVERYMRIAEQAAEFRGSGRERAENLLARAQLAGSRADAEQAAEAFERMKMPWHLARARRILIA